MDLKEIDAVFSAVTEETYEQLKAEIERLTNYRDVVGKILGKDKVQNRPSTRKFNHIGRDSGLGKALLALAEGPDRVSSLIKKTGKSGIYAELQNCPHARKRSDGCYELTNLGRKWVEESKTAA